MSRIKLRDKDIARAAALVCEAMILPDPKDCCYTFSETFERKMEKLVRVEERHSNGRMFLKRALAIVVAAMLGMTTWLAIDTDARAAFTKWIREVYENCIVYRSMGEIKSYNIEQYTLEYIPDGYALIDMGKKDNQGFAVWEKIGEENDLIYFEYRWNNNSRLSIMLQPENYIYSPVEVLEKDADWYQSINKNKSNLLVWVDETKNIVFSIDTICSQLDTLHMAESICLVK